MMTPADYWPRYEHTGGLWKIIACRSSRLVLAVTAVFTVYILICISKVDSLISSLF